jgi:hypothetical protein
MMTDIYRPEAGHSQTFDTVTGYAGSLFLTEDTGSKVGVTVTAQDARAIANAFFALANEIESAALKAAKAAAKAAAESVAKGQSA